MTFLQNKNIPFFNSSFEMCGMGGLEEMVWVSNSTIYNYFGSNWAALNYEETSQLDYLIYNTFVPIIFSMFDTILIYVDENKITLLTLPYIFLFFHCLILLLNDIYKNLSFSSFLISLPFIGNRIRKKLKNITCDLENSLNVSNGVIYDFIEEIPTVSKTPAEVNEIIQSMEYEEQDINKVSGVVYLGDKVHDKKCARIFEKFSSTNPLHPDLFPQIRNMEIDVVNMVSKMFHGDEYTCGNLTYGGTESILLACLTYRDYARREKYINQPNIVAFDSVHPAFDKACHYFNIELRKINTQQQTDFSVFQYKAVKQLLKPYIDQNTICIVASAPNYSYGLVDPIWGMSKLALEYNIGFHVDACMGGFLIPFLSEYKWINFTIPGVTSISVDTHKYGYSFKGSSVLLFKNHSYKQHQHFIQKHWNGGIYATPTMMGSKSGGLIAATWASLLFTGRENYILYANNIRNNVLFICDFFKQNSVLKKNIQIIGEPQLNIIAFTSSELNIYSVLDEMKKKGWNLSVMQNPSAFHLCITNLHSRENCKMFCQNMIQSVETCLKNKNKKLSGTLALYGSSTQVQNSIFLKEIINNYITLLSKKTISQKYKMV